RPAEERAIIETRFVRRTGMLPAALSDTLIGGMFSEDPAAQVAAARRFVAFEDSDPVLLVPLPADTLTRARTITAFAYPGLPPARIVHLAEERVAQQEAQEEVQAAKEAEGEPPESDVPEVPGDKPLESDSSDLPEESADSFDDADDGPLSDGERGEVELDRETEDELIRQLRGSDDLLPQAPAEGQTVAQKPDKKTRALFEQLATEFERARKLGIRRFIPPATRRQFDSLVEALPRGKELEELSMAMTPVAGEIQSAREANEAFKRFASSVEKGNAGEAATAAGESITALLGAIPIVGSVGRGGKAIGKAASTGIKRAGKAKAVKAAPPKAPIKPFARTPGGDEVNRLEAVRRKVKAKGNFAQSADDAFGATRFPPRSAKENVLRGLAAVDKALDDALRGGTGVVKNAMHRKDFGAVTFYWGNPGNPAKQYLKGSGLSHIIAKHGVEMVDDVLETVARGKLTDIDRGRALITHKGHKAVLSLHRFGERETWLLTGYRTPKGNDINFDLSKLRDSMFFKTN
ncbi:MAG: hypothetical protein O7D31_01860, partial [Alphaproteobacteria bacterium]|nr:hypothetical protein [Alphaproteobacteria bacterium]